MTLLPHPQTAAEGRRTPRRWRDPEALRRSRQRLGLRQSSGAFAARADHYPAL